MIFEKDQKLNGFIVLQVRESEELRGRTVLLEHEGTGAQIFWVDNGAENMVFSITFRTLPEDSTGVFHILEHSVLCGSEKYPVKEPFVELLKSSMNTFLNALTFQDMTMYPVASRNPRDLLNLAGVYLDAVFAPKVLSDRRRFCQEGWHIDRDGNGEPVYKGVVFNEMKGAMSDTDTLIERRIMQQMFPDTCYGYNSGGDPEAIPSLTYEKFCEQYRRYYHPSNALIYLDGALPIEETLVLIASYLDQYDRMQNLPVYTFQTPVGSEDTIVYELGQEEPEENRGHLTLARITGTWKDRAENMARGIICDVLTGSNEAMLKRAALERGLAEDLSASVDDTTLQSWVTIHADNVTDGREEELLALLEETGEKIAREGLDRRAVEASLNRAVYMLREEDEPQGIGRCIRCVGNWIYGADPTDALETAGVVKELKGYLETGRFDELAADMLLNKANRVVLHTLPSRSLGEEKRRREAEAVRKIVSGWTAEEKETNDRLIASIEAWQNEPDRLEDLKTLPRLRKEDADIEPEWVQTEVCSCGGVSVMAHRLNCNGVVHLRAYFLLTDYSLEELTKLSQLTGMLGRLPTKEHDAWTLQQEIKRWTGSVGFTIITRAEPGQDDTCAPYLCAFVSALEENAEKAWELVAEILTSTLFEDRDKMTEMFRQNELAARQRILGAGHMIGVKNALSHFSAENAVKNALDGDAAVAYIHLLAREPEKELTELLRLSERMMKETFCRSRMILGVTSTEEILPEKLTAAFPEGTRIPETRAYSVELPMAAGFRIPAQIGFAVRGYRLGKLGLRFEGSMWLATSILTLGYLWNRVRVQGGAYGAGIQVDRSGNIFSYSFRDPTPAKTLKADGGAAEFLRDFAEQGEDMDPYIISALNELNPLLSPRDKGSLADGRCMTGYTREEAEKIRLQILHAKPEDLVRCADWLNAFSRDGAVCIVAHQDALNECEGLTVRDL
ncbi:MAG: insulinase family protein [Clostridia bacterium]|nr:insulinase family protein [Clostridia bacterium]